MPRALLRMEGASRRNAGVSAVRGYPRVRHGGPLPAGRACPRRACTLRQRTDSNSADTAFRLGELPGPRREAHGARGPVPPRESAPRKTGDPARCGSREV